MTTFEHTHTQTEHYEGTLVNYDSTVLAIGGGSSSWEALTDYDSSVIVEEYKSNAKHWNEHWEDHTMSPVDGIFRLAGFTALSIVKSLFIFGQWQCYIIKLFEKINNRRRSARQKESRISNIERIFEQTASLGVGWQFLEYFATRTMYKKG